MKQIFVNAILGKNLVFQFYGKISKKIPFWWVQMMTPGFTLSNAMINLDPQLMPKWSCLMMPK